MKTYREREGKFIKANDNILDINRGERRLTLLEAFWGIKYASTYKFIPHNVCATPQIISRRSFQIIKAIK